MKQTLMIFLMLFFAFGTKAQQKINITLKQELDSIYALDQKYRKLISLANEKSKADSISRIVGVDTKKMVDYLWAYQNRIDSSNLDRIEQIIKTYGYPGKTLVGTPTNEAVFYVLQHSPKIKQYLSLIEQAANQQELPFQQYAKMQDRFLMQEEKEQVYGTQVYGFRSINQHTGKEEWIQFVWPINDPANINARRKQAGFQETVEEYVKHFGIEYKVVTLEDVKKCKANNFTSKEGKGLLAVEEGYSNKPIKTD